MEGQERVEVLGATTTKLLRLGFSGSADRVSVSEGGCMGSVQ